MAVGFLSCNHRRTPSRRPKVGETCIARRWCRVDRVGRRQRHAGGNSWAAQTLHVQYIQARNAIQEQAARVRPGNVAHGVVQVDGVRDGVIGRMVEANESARVGQTFPALSGDENADGTKRRRGKGEVSQTRPAFAFWR